MPIYEFVCDHCHVEFEELIRAATDRVDCPKCGGKRVSRKLSVFAARGGQSPETPCHLPPGPACASCGDPNGPCPMQG